MPRKSVIYTCISEPDNAMNYLIDGALFKERE